MPPPQPDILGPLEPIAPAEETISTEETTRADVPIQPTQKATTETSSSHDPTTTWSSLYLVFTYYISRHNYLFWCFIFWDWMYYMIISHIVLSQSNIYTSFFIIFVILLFPLLITLFFFNHVVSPIRLRLHVTQEVPLPSFIFFRSCHIEGNVNLG